MQIHGSEWFRISHGSQFCTIKLFQNCEKKKYFYFFVMNLSVCIFESHFIKNILTITMFFFVVHYFTWSENLYSNLITNISYYCPWPLEGRKATVGFISYFLSVHLLQLISQKPCRWGKGSNQLIFIMLSEVYQSMAKPVCIGRWFHCIHVVGQSRLTEIMCQSGIRLVPKLALSP